MSSEVLDQGLTKLGVAEREIISAIRLLFDGSDTVPVYVVASAAREITTSMCIARRVQSFLDDVQGRFPEKSTKELYRLASRHAGFFKHADRDPAARLVDYDDAEAEAVLFTAVHDFGRLCQGKPVEAQACETRQGINSSQWDGW